MVSYCSSSISKTLSLTIFAQLTIRHRQTDSRISMAMTTLMLCIGRKNPMLYRPIGLPSLPVSCAVDAYMLLSLPECEGGLPGHWSAASPLEWCKPQLLPPLLYPRMVVLLRVTRLRCPLPSLPRVEAGENCDSWKRKK